MIAIVWLSKKFPIVPKTKIGPAKLHSIDRFSQSDLSIFPSEYNWQAVATPTGNPLNKLIKKT